MAKKQMNRKLSKRNIKPKEDKVETQMLPVRGDTVSFWNSEGGFRYALVLNAQDKEATILTSDNDRITLPFSDLNEVHDNRMELLRSLPEDEATQHREDYLDKWIARCQERADQAAIARGAPVDEYGRVLRHKPGRKASDEKARRVNEYCDKFVKFVENSKHPVTKKDMGDLIPASIYMDVINVAVDSGKVVRNGNRRSTNYTFPNRTYETMGDKSAPSVDTEVLNVIVDYILSNSPVSRADINAHFGLSPAEWTTVRLALQNDDRIAIEGEKRGTRYVSK